MMNTNKRFQNPNPPPNNMQQYSNRPYPPPQGVGVPPQGAAGSAPRNPNAPQNLRVQNGPPRQSQPQQGGQVHSQSHAGMTGIQAPQHQHPHNPHGQAAPQGQQPHPAQLQFAGYPPQFYIPSPAASYHQYFPPAQYLMNQMNQVQRIVNPQQGHPQNFVIIPHQQMFQAQHQNQQMVQQHPQAQHAAAANYYHPGPYMAAPTRLPLHTHAQPVHPSNVQGPQVHQPSGHAPQTSQHSHQIPHVPQQQQPPAANTNQIPNRTEGANPAPVERRRERKLLKIIDPNTGACVIGDSNANTSSTTEAAQSSETLTVEGNGDVVGTASSEPQTPEVSIHASDDDVPRVPSPVVEASVEEQGNESKAKIRSEFFQKITQASDDGRNAAGGNSQGAVVNPPSPTPAAPAPEQLESPSIDSSKSQQAALTPTPNPNTSSDDSKDTSLVSVSPVPLEVYLTPRKPSPPGLRGEGVLEDDLPESHHEDADESLTTTVEPEDEVVSPSQEEAEVREPVSETSTTLEAEVENGCADGVSKDAEEVPSNINDKSETPSTQVPCEEPASVAHHNGEVEEGEIPEDIEEIGAEEPEVDAQDGDGGSNDKDLEPAGKVKYGRDFLIAVGQNMKQTKNPIPEGILADVAKDAGPMMRSQHMMNKSPGGGMRGNDFSRMRSVPGQGPKPGLGMGMGMNYPRGGHGGMMGWAPIVVPPRAPPPKVLELTREEVKLHKSENAWKPGVKQSHRGGGGGGGGGASEPADPEEAITDDIVKKTRGILNKLTPENFDKLTQKFMNLPLEDKEERISKVIKVVFEKAVDEPSFSKEYAKMVFAVCNASQETSRKFRKQILDQCQQEFQKTNTDEDKIQEVEKQLEEAEEDKKDAFKAELEELKFQSRRRSLGNIRFIGELYKLHMLTPKIMVECVAMLLVSNDEENLEGLCKLLTTVGQKLEGQLRDIENRVEQVRKLGLKPDDSAMKMPKFIPEDRWTEKTFATLKSLSESKKLSSRIRFALLDVVELRENHYKPRRDANAPKTIEEVRRDAIKQEMEEKRQISNLTPLSSDPRVSSRAGPPQPKKGDWSVQNKSTRFQQVNKGSKESPVSSLPSFAPQTGLAWGRSTGGGSSQPKPSAPLPPRFMNNMNRFQGLSEERDRDSRENRLGPPQQTSMNSRDSAPSQPPFSTPFAPPTHKISPAPSSTSSRENSRPVSPKDNSLGNNLADTKETVKNIFEEYCSVGSAADSIDWIKQRFPDDKVVEFVDQLARQVGEMSKIIQQQKAGTLIRSLIKSGEITLSKDMVLSTLSSGVIADLPDIVIDVPRVSNYLAQFLVEIFHDDRTLDWLLLLREPLQDGYESTWDDLCVESLTSLRSKMNEDVVRSMYQASDDNSCIPLEDLEWLSPKPEKIAQEMAQVLKKNLTVNNKEEIRQALKEHSWDLREDLINHSLIEAICIVSWNSKTHQWDDEALRKFCPLLSTDPKLFPDLWKHAKKFFESNNIEKAQSEELWQILYENNIATTDVQPEPGD